MCTNFQNPKVCKQLRKSVEDRLAKFCKWSLILIRFWWPGFEFVSRESFVLENLRKSTRSNLWNLRTVLNNWGCLQHGWPDLPHASAAPVSMPRWLSLEPALSWKNRGFVSFISAGNYWFRSIPSYWPSSIRKNKKEKVILARLGASDWAYPSATHTHLLMPYILTPPPHPFWKTFPYSEKVGRTLSCFNSLLCHNLTFFLRSNWYDFLVVS